MIKYLLFILIGIIIYILLDRKDGFSIGVPWCIKSKDFLENRVPYTRIANRTFDFDLYDDAKRYFDENPRMVAEELNDREKYDIYFQRFGITFYHKLITELRTKK